VEQTVVSGIVADGTSTGIVTEVVVLRLGGGIVTVITGAGTDDGSVPAG